MGGKRNKFERIYSESENDSSECESPEKEIQNVSNHNSNSVNDHGKQIISQNEKYLVTRSKRKYSKRELPELKFRIDNIEYNKPQNVGISDSSKSTEKRRLDTVMEESKNQPTKKKRETIKSLDEKIRSANDFLSELNKKLENRDEEISKLKKCISENRGSEVANLLRAPAANNMSEREQKGIDELPHDFPIIGEYDENSDFEQFPEEEEEEEVEENIIACKPRKKENKKRRKSKSRSRSRERHGKRRRSRSRSRNHDDHDNRENSQNGTENSKFDKYKNDQDVQNYVKLMVEKQIKERMQKDQMIKNTSGMDINNNSFGNRKSRSETTLYRPAIERQDLKGSPLPMLYNSYVVQSSTPKLNDTHDNPFNLVEAGNIVEKVNPDTIDSTLSKLRIIADAKLSSSAKEEVQKQEEQIREARQAAESAILQAERYKARIQQPNRGKEINFNNPLPNPSRAKCYDDEVKAMRYLDNEDDEFFHTTCHIDESIREKIAKGKFIELEKLIQKRILQYGGERGRQNATHQQRWGVLLCSNS